MRLDRLTTARCKNRIFSQELVLLSHIVDALAEPRTQYSWLDIACGTGNVLHHVRNILKEKANALYYFGFDLDYNHVRECSEASPTTSSYGQIVGDRMGLHVEAQTGQLEQLTNVYSSRRFDMVSLINALHELPMKQFPSLFLDMLYLCSNDGRLAIFDTTKLLETEPGALPIGDEDMQTFLDAFFSSLGAENISQPVSKCQFSATEAFFFRLRKNLVPTFDKLYEQEKEQIVSKLLEKWKDILIQKLATINQNIYQLADELFLMASEETDTTDKLNELSSLTQQFWACYNELKTF